MYIDIKQRFVEAHQEHRVFYGLQDNIPQLDVELMLESSFSKLSLNKAKQILHKIKQRNWRKNQDEETVHQIQTAQALQEFLDDHIRPVISKAKLIFGKDVTIFATHDFKSDSTPSEVGYIYTKCAESGVWTEHSVFWEDREPNYSESRH